VKSGLSILVHSRFCYQQNDKNDIEPNESYQQKKKEVFGSFGFFCFQMMVEGQFAWGFSSRMRESDEFAAGQQKVIDGSTSLSSKGNTCSSFSDGI
jgi:hypothetical protein